MGDSDMTPEMRDMSQFSRKGSANERRISSNQSKTKRIISYHETSKGLKMIPLHNKITQIGFFNINFVKFF